MRWAINALPWTMITDKGMRIHLTQCARCRQITWSNVHPEAVWTGPVRLQSRPLGFGLESLPAPPSAPRTTGGR